LQVLANKKEEKEQMLGLSKAEHIMEREQAEKATSLFDSKMRNKPPELRFRYMFSEIDPTTNKSLVWDLWIKFPFKVSKEECETLKKDIQSLFFEKFRDLYSDEKFKKRISP